MSYGRLLRRQLLRHLGTLDVPPGPWSDLMGAIERAYQQADADRTLLERSLEMTSRELIARHEELRLLSSTLVELAHEVAQDWGDVALPLRQITVRVADALATHRVGVWVIEPDRLARRIDVYDRRTARHEDETSCSERDYGPIAELLQRERLVAVPDGSVHPATAALYHRWFAPSGIRAALVAACRVAGRLVGLVTIGDEGRRRWSPEEQSFVASIADLVSLVLEGHLRQRAEQARAQLEASLIEAQRMESIGQLAGGVAHDFNNLLTPVLFAAHSLRHDDPSPEERHELADEILTAAASARDLTAQLLAVGRKQSLELRPINLNEEIYQTTRLLGRTIPESISFELRLDPRLGVVRADAGQLRQVLMNLVINARDAMLQGGTLTVATRNGGTPTRPLVVLEVSDTGQGMSPETVGRIFDPFFTTKPMGRGTGLGLSMVYGIIQQHGGTIDVRSTPGVGTTFEVALSRTDDTAPGDVPTLPALSRPRGDARGTILVVDDEEPVRRAVRRILHGEGYDVLDVGDADAAIALCRDRTSIDLILTDVIMPRTNGKELVGALDRPPNCSVVYMSGYSSEFLGSAGALDPGVILLRKPFTPTELLGVVRGALNPR